MNKSEKYQEFCNYIKNEYINKLSGESEEDEYIIGELPSDKIIIGLLDSGDFNDINKQYESMHLVKVNFFINKKAKGLLHVNVKGNLFYNVLPEYKDQKINQSSENSDKDDEQKTIKITNKFKRIKIDDNLIEDDNPELGNIPTLDVNINNNTNKNNTFKETFNKILPYILIVDVIIIIIVMILIFV